MQQGRPVVWLSPLLALSVVCLADVVTISAARDNTLYEDAAGSLSNGAGADFFVGRTGGGAIRRGLVAFDVAGSIPAGATVTSVTLTLRLSRGTLGSQTVELRRVSADWGEAGSNSTVMGGGMGAPAQTGDTTWVHTFFNTATWTTAGGDFDGSASASASVSAVGQYTWGSTPQMVADVQDWLDNPTTDFGWVLLGNEAAAATAKRFASKDNPTAANRPMLTIEFTPLTDCNSNGVDDAQDITGGSSDDCDADGVPDECQSDADQDGTIDPCDLCPDDPDKIAPGDCGCGVADTDGDSDGTPDCDDGCPNDPGKTAPGPCGCGNLDTDSDGDGVANCLDGCPDDPLKTVPGKLGCGVAEDDADTDGVPDSIDKCPGENDNADRDFDGTPDCLDECPDDALKVAPGVCGCGVEDTDSDGDGVADCDDDCPDDPDKAAPGSCGCGTPDLDGDGDGVPDCVDNCPDVPNPGQQDADNDGTGDACDESDAGSNNDAGPTAPANDPPDGGAGVSAPPATPLPCAAPPVALLSLGGVWFLLTNRRPIRRPPSSRASAVIRSAARDLAPQLSTPTNRATGPALYRARHSEARAFPRHGRRA